MSALLSTLLAKETPRCTSSAVMKKMEQEFSRFFDGPSLIDDGAVIGIEVEVEKVRNNDVQQYPVWRQCEDNSLRNAGFEYVSVPMKGRTIVFALNWLSAKLNDDCQFSPRTSVHIHLNALDMTLEQIGLMGLVTAAFERPIFRFIGGDRARNNFCVPIQEAKAYWMFEAFFKESFDFPIGEHNRYLALNLDALRKFGTLEFRHMGGTKDVTRILHWINIILSLKKYVMVTPRKTILDIIYDLNTSSKYDVWFQEVFGENTVLQKGRLQQEMSGAISNLKRVVVDNKWKEELQKTASTKDFFMMYLRKPKTLTPTYTREFPIQTPPIRVREGRARIVPQGLRFADDVQPIGDWRVSIDLATQVLQQEDDD